MFALPKASVVRHVGQMKNVPDPDTDVKRPIPFVSSAAQILWIAAKPDDAHALERE